jgi:hypothetical protein
VRRVRQGHCNAISTSDQRPVLKAVAAVAGKKKMGARPASSAKPRPVFPGTGATKAAPVLSHKFHREALAVAIDPETASVSKYVAPTQEGGLHRFPAKPSRTMELPLYVMLFKLRDKFAVMFAFRTAQAAARSASARYQPAVSNR